MIRTTRIDRGAAGALIALYAIAVLVAMPPREFVRPLGGGAVVFGVIARAAYTLGRRPIPGLSVLLVGFLSAIVLVFPTFPAMGGHTHVAIPIGFLGVQAAMLLWAAELWQPAPPISRPISLLRAWRFGALAAFGLSLLAIIPVLGAAAREDSPRIFLILPAYFVGFLLAATAYALLQRIAHLATGRYLIGVVAGFCMYGAVGPVVSLVKHEPIDLRRLVIIAAIAGGVVGPAVSLSITSDVAAT